MKYELVYAELTPEGFAEDVFRIHPVNPKDQSVEIGVTHLHQAGQHRGQPVILIHAEFCNRFQWYRRDIPCLAMELISQNFEVWIPEMRGHGLSPANRAYRRNSLRDYVDYDLPAIQRFVSERHPTPAIWIGYGTGAMTIAMALELNTLQRQQMASIALIGMKDARSVLRCATQGFWDRLAARRRGMVRSLTSGLDRETEPYVLLDTLPRPEFKRLATLAHASTLPPLLLVELLVDGMTPESHIGRKLLWAWGEASKKKVSVPARSLLGALAQPASYKPIRGALNLWLKGRFVDNIAELT